jgi:hypothetical protein
MVERVRTLNEVDKVGHSMQIVSPSFVCRICLPIVLVSTDALHERFHPHVSLTSRPFSMTTFQEKIRVESEFITC